MRLKFNAWRATWTLRPLHRIYRIPTKTAWPKSGLVHDNGELVNFAITLRSGKSFIGAIGLRINQTDDNAELGYWIGKPYWNLGYATEAAEAVVRYSFEVLGLNRIHARHFKRIRRRAVSYRRSE